MSFLGKGVNKFFTSLGSLFKKLVELIFNLLGFIKFKISKKNYNAREESSRNGKIAGRRIKNNMDKFAIKAQVGTDKGLIFLGKFLRLFTFQVLKLFNAISKGLYNASEKSKDKFTSFNISQDEKNKEKFIEFDNLIAKCDDIENYEEAAMTNYDSDISTNLENTIFHNVNSNNFHELNYNNDKNIQNKINKENTYSINSNLHENINTYNNDEDDDVKEYTKKDKLSSDLNHTLHEDMALHAINTKNDNDIKEFTLHNDKYDLDKTLLEDSTFHDSVRLSSQQFRENTMTNKDIHGDINILNKDDNFMPNNDEEGNYDYEYEYSDNPEENTTKDDSSKKIFNFLKKKDKTTSFDETFHGEDYGFNSSIKLANENYLKNKDIETSHNKIQTANLKVTQEEDDSDKTQMINKDVFRESLNSKLQSQYNNRARTYKSSLDDDDESIRRFLSDDE